MLEVSFKNIAQILSIVAKTGSTTTKKDLLIKFQDMPGLKEVLHFLYNPYIKTGIKDAKLNRAIQQIPATKLLSMSNAGDVLWLINFLENNNTGTDQMVSAAAAFVECWNFHDYDFDANTSSCGWAARGIVTKNLQIGVKATTLNEVYGKGFIPVVGIMRGMHAPTNFRGVYIATEKIDGNRRLCANKETGVEIYTRSGRRDYGLVEIEEQVAQLPKGYVYDSEGTKIGDFRDNVECRQASASLFNSEGMRRGGKIQIFDMIPQAEYDAGISKRNAVERKIMLCFLFGDLEGCKILRPLISNETAEGILTEVCSITTSLLPYQLANVEALPIIGIVHNMKEALAMAQPFWEAGKEGLMLNEIHGKYEVSPNPRKHLLKIKATIESVVRVIRVYEGCNSNVGTLGGFVVTFTASDGLPYTFNVGGGLSAWQRDYYWNNPQDIVGKDIEIEHFGESVNAQGGRALNCPVFKRIKGDEDNE